jgi:hypothetical protein
VHCFVMQPWITIRGQSQTVAPINQSENCWLDLTMYQDVVAWLQVDGVTLGGLTSVGVAYQTAPIKDELAFVNVTNAVTFNSSGWTIVTPMLASSTSVPLSRWLRWQVVVQGTGGPWDILFRIFIAANAPGPQRRTPTTNITQRQAPPLTPPSTPLHLQPGGGVSLAYPSPTTYGVNQPVSRNTGIAVNTGSSGAFTPNIRG